MLQPDVAGMQKRNLNIHRTHGTTSNSCKSRRGARERSTIWVERSKLKPYQENTVPQPIIRLLALLVIASLPAVAMGVASETAGPTYLQLNPAFTVNVGEPSTRVSFAKVDVSLRLESQDGKDRVMHHRPGIRDIIVSSLSNQPLAEVEASDRREFLRAALLERIQAFMQQEEGEALITDLLFTSFVLQR